MNKAIPIIGIILFLLVIVYAAIALSGPDTTSTNSSNIFWSTDLNSALQQAKTTNKMVFIDFYADWCGYCRQMDQDTYTDPLVQERLAQSYIAVKIDTDKNPDLSAKYGIIGLPTMVILDSNGQEIKRISGYQSADQLLSQL
ncbi:MAG: thioredoxin domain-containing protein [Methanobacteriaceae archaeon]|nr:thioredoxin domain-containing protein [Methanobacteriaceae archaeon]